MYRYFFSSPKTILYATVFGPDVDTMPPGPALEPLTPANREQFCTTPVTYFVTPPAYVWYVQPQAQQPWTETKIRPYSIVYVEDPRLQVDFTGLTIFMDIVDIVIQEDRVCARFQGWRTASADFVNEHGGLLLLPSVFHVPLSCTNLWFLRMASSIMPVSALRRLVYDQYNLVHSSETYQQPRLRNYVTRGPDPVLLRRFEAPPITHTLYAFKVSDIVSDHEHIVSDHELHSTVESHLASEDIAEMVLGAGLTDTLEWDDEPARAETALGTVSEGTSATLCDIPLSESEDTLGSGISELEVIELRWNGDVIYGGVVYADDEDSVADNLSDLVFATNAIEPTVAGPRYDVNGYLIEDEEDMIIGSLLDD
ncbi:hypothetical protein C8T65DRAFT_738034 [Cerioporus squamosus]|nr:hypothetical protein C8T65DRAFT_738034 [Cerioporus squamosus]